MRLIKPLLKKRWGIPAALLVVLCLASGVVATTLTVLSISVTIQYPTHESLTIDLGKIQAGETATGSMSGYFGLPAIYDVTWTLGGATAKYSSVSIAVDYNNDTTVDATLTLTSGPQTVSGITAASYTANYSVSVTAATRVRAGTSIVSDDASLIVSMTASYVSG